MTGRPLTGDERHQLLNGRKLDGETERDRLSRVAGEIADARDEATARGVIAELRAEWNDLPGRIAPHVALQDVRQAWERSR